MFESFFGLSSLPFQIAPDARFYFGSSNHMRALAHLSYGLSQGDGFIVVTGDIGAGKTTLIDYLVSRLDADIYRIARIATTQLSPSALLRMILSAFELPIKGSEKASMLRQFGEFFQQNQAAGRHVLLIIDEVQNLPFATLEELRMLSNLASGAGAPLQTCLIGQPQFRDILMSARAEQLRQRIFTSYHLAALQKNEVEGYIKHRLRVASWEDDPFFEEDTFTQIYSLTGGVPRRVNLLCSRLLLHAYLNESHRISGDDVEAVGGEWQKELGSPETDATAETARDWPNSRAVVIRRLKSVELKLQAHELALQRGAVEGSINKVSLGNDVSIAQANLVSLDECVIGDNTEIGPFVEVRKNARIGARCKLRSHAFVASGAVIEDDVTIGHGAVIGAARDSEYADVLSIETGPVKTKTLIRRGASIGANVVVAPGIVVGQNAIVGPGSWVRQDVPDHAIVSPIPPRLEETQNPPALVHRSSLPVIDEPPFRASARPQTASALIRVVANGGPGRFDDAG